jgi:hypothetical protein
LFPYLKRILSGAAIFNRRLDDPSVVFSRILATSHNNRYRLFLARSSDIAGRRKKLGWRSKTRVIQLATAMSVRCRKRRPFYHGYCRTRRWHGTISRSVRECATASQWNRTFKDRSIAAWTSFLRLIATVMGGPCSSRATIPNSSAYEWLGSPATVEIHFRFGLAALRGEWAD